MKVLVVICVLFAVASAAVFEAPPSTHPDFPGHCYFDDFKTGVKPGEVFNVPGQCAEYRCNSDLSYSGTTCGLVGAPPGCTTSAIDTTKNYPDCCPKVVC